MADQMVLKTQQWLNTTYGDKSGFGSVPENGNTGWGTIYGLIRALQIELGITATANNFGSSTQSRFNSRWPNGITKTSTSSNVHGIIQGALWCKGYPQNMAVSPRNSLLTSPTLSLQSKAISG